MRNIVFTATAKQHLDDIYMFIARDNPFYADKVCETILGFISGILALFPHIGKIFSQQGFLEVVEPGFKYKIIYFDTGTDIIISAIYKYQDDSSIKEIVKG